VLGLQTDVARAIAEEIEITFKRTARRASGSDGNVDPGVYEAYLKGRYFVDRGTKAHQAVDYFEKAIAQDAGYAPAYAGLADAYGQLGWALSEEVPPEEAYRRALSAAGKALALDEGLASAHGALARIRWKYEWNWDAAERSMTRAIELDPNSAVAHESYFDLLSAMGRHEEAYVRLRRAAALDPVSVTIHYDFGLHFARTGDNRALAALEARARGTYVSPHNFALVYASAGRSRDATDALERAYRQRDPWLSLILVQPQFATLNSEARFQALLRKMSLPNSVVTNVSQ